MIVINTEKNARELERLDAYAPSSRRNVAVNYHPKGSSSAYHTHDFYEINYILSGTLSNEVAGTSLRMKEGDAILMHPGVFHAVRPEADAVILNILIRPRWLESALLSAEGEALSHFAARMSGEEYVEYVAFLGAEGARETLSALLCRAEAADGLAAEGALLLLLSDLEGRAREVILPAERNRGLSRFASILAYLYSHAEELTVAALSERFGYSPSHLSRLFRRYTGKPPAVLLGEARLTRAALLLQESDASVASIAAAAGFPSPPYFHRLFLRTFGETPASYRRSHRQGRERRQDTP